jgi:hypothetical protein
VSEEKNEEKSLPHCILDLCFRRIHSAAAHSRNQSSRENEKGPGFQVFQELMPQ